MSSISKNSISIHQLYDLLESSNKIDVSDDLRSKIRAGRAYLEEVLDDDANMIYGINTGFGSLCNTRIPKEDYAALQKNLVRSHAAGSGKEISKDITKLIFLLKIINLSQGYSGVREVLIDHLLDIYNAGILPVIYEFGSLGASGDLAPLAHLALTIIGEGESQNNDQKEDSNSLLKKYNISPIELSAKEGLAILNGTQFSLAFACHGYTESLKIWKLANLLTAMSLDAYDGRLEPFHQALHKIRPHEGQRLVAESVLSYLKDSGLAHAHKVHIQDPYSFRCVPQVHGASYQALEHVRSVIETEINSVTDNPSVFAEEDKILTGGNFHAQPIALILDYLKIAMAEIGNISERRTFKLVNGDRGLPDYLTRLAGTHSGFMIAQYTAASIVSKNKQLCSPSSVDSITSSKGQEDHVSMAANAGTLCYDLIENLWQILAIEFLVSCHALSLRKPAKSSSFIENILSDFRKVVPFEEEDHILSADIKKAVSFVKNLSL